MLFAMLFGMLCGSPRTSKAFINSVCLSNYGSAQALKMVSLFEYMLKHEALCKVSTIVLWMVHHRKAHRKAHLKAHHKAHREAHRKAHRKVHRKAHRSLFTVRRVYHARTSTH